MSDDPIFRRREFKGSRLRCLMATSLADREVAAFLNQLVQPYALPGAWEQRLPAGNSWFVPIIRSARVSAVVVEAKRA